MGKVKEGLECIEQSISLDKSYMRAVCYRAYARYCLELFDEALEGNELLI